MSKNTDNDVHKNEARTYVGNNRLSIRKTGIALCGSGFSLRTLKKQHDVFCPSLYLYVKLVPRKV